ncbi:hypothetical protein [Rhodococcus maanshanensis]|uniref:Uncharacterized protein n=1 Tax=Rhodococcus maanshanensis TaxID=183556 RepID=A0A1H7YFE9_9NOCA|nr:hypothetical protein [Rhodococcus maanshanensis]SEM44966.1 hypothetical protein SAMN05444583_13933 [Rhodococcus maanshanensis]
MKVRSRVALTTIAMAAILPLGGVAHAAPSTPGEEIQGTGTDGSQISWQIPNDGLAKRGGASPSFDTKTGSNGEVSTTITIPDPAAPSRYEFPLNLPAGFTTDPQEDGSITVNNAAGLPVGSFAKPWATDANGGTISTSLKVEGNSLVQYVNFTEKTAFPVTADPSWNWGWVSGHVYLNKQETAKMGVGGFVASWLPNPATVWGGRTLSAIAAYGTATGQCVQFKVGFGLGGLPLLPGSPLPFGAGILGVDYYRGGYCS